MVGCSVAAAVQSRYVDGDRWLPAGDISRGSVEVQRVREISDERLQVTAVCVGGVVVCCRECLC